MIATKPESAEAAGAPLLLRLLSRPYPAVMGVLNVTPDSSSPMAGSSSHRDRHWHRPKDDRRRR